LGAHGFCFGVIQKGVGPKNLLPWRLATRQTHWLNLAILWELVLLAAIVYVPFFQGPFGTFSLGATDWLLVVTLALTGVPSWKP
jgi:hypothetical protein